MCPHVSNISQANFQVLLAKLRLVVGLAAAEKVLTPSLILSTGSIRSGVFSC